MDSLSRAFACLSRMMIAAGLILALSSNAVFSAENCERLEGLANQYAGAELTSAQKQLKRKMVAWYATHCIRHEDR
jgi:hypothetical protein